MKFQDTHELLLYALSLEKNVRSIYQILSLKATICEEKKALKLLAEESDIQVNLIKNALEEYKNQRTYSDGVVNLDDSYLISSVIVDENSAETTFDMAVKIEEKVIRLFKQVEDEAESPRIYLMARNLVDVKSRHIETIKRYQSSKIITKICGLRTTEPLPGTPRPG